MQKYFPLPPRHTIPVLYRFPKGSGLAEAKTSLAQRALILKLRATAWLGVFLAATLLATAQSRGFDRREHESGHSSHYGGGGVPDNWWEPFAFLAVCWVGALVVLKLWRDAASVVRDRQNAKNARQRSAKIDKFSQYIRRAEYLVSNQELEHAITAYNDAIKAWESMIEDHWLLHPRATTKLVNIFCQRCFLFLRLGRRREAILDYHRAVMHATNRVEAEKVRERLSSLRNYDDLHNRWADPDIDPEDADRLRSEHYPVGNSKNTLIVR